MGLYPKEIKYELAAMGLPRGPNSNVYLVDPANGSDNNPGDRWTKPLASVAAAYAKCTDGQHDVVAFIGSPTADYPTTAITWAKNFTHLVGLTNDLPGMSQRCRIVNHADNDLATLFTLSGYGCIVKNIQFFDGKDKAEDGACVLVSGNRNRLDRVFVAGMGNAATANRSGSYSLTVSGSENYVVDSTIGLDTIKRTQANSELIVSGGRNRFDRCVFRSYSETAGKFLVKIDNSGGDLRDQIFWDCLFFNYTSNWANGIDNAFDMPAAGATHYVILKNCTLVGVNSGWADTVTHIYSDGPAPNAGFGIGLNPTT